MIGQVVRKVRFSKYTLVTYRLELLGIRLEYKRKLMRVWKLDDIIIEDYGG